MIVDSRIDHQSVWVALQDGAELQFHARRIIVVERMGGTENVLKGDESASIIAANPNYEGILSTQSVVAIDDLKCRDKCRPWLLEVKACGRIRSS